MTRRGFGALGLLGCLLTGPATPARAQCTYTALSSGTGITVSASPQPVSFNQGQRYYTAVGVRSAPGDDWNLEVYQTTAAAPACVATLLGGSAAATGVDFVVGDFNLNHNPLGLHYPLATRAAGAGAATVEWDDGANTLVMNGPLLSRNTGASLGDVLEVWDANLSAGVQYTFTFNPVGADLKLLIFKSGAGTYWAGRSGALVQTASTTTFTPASTGFHGIVVVNDNGGEGSYTLGVGTCQSPTVLIAGATATTSQAERYYSFNQTATFWTAVGVRGASNWNIGAYDAGSGGSYPVCYSGQLATSTLAAPTVDLVVGDFNELLVGTKYARVHLDQDLGAGTATVEWDSGLDFLDPDPLAGGATPTVMRATGASDVLEVWDLYLETGISYQVYFNVVGANARFLLFPPGLDWAGRSAAVLDRGGAIGATPFLAGETGYYGLVVVNDDGATGSYEFRVFRDGVLDALGASRPATALERVEPNPMSGRGLIRFALHDHAEVGFDIVDVAGRRVGEIPARTWEPGRWSVPWSPRSSGRVSAGLYFILMRVDGEIVGRRKVALLD